MRTTKILLVASPPLLAIACAAFVVTRPGTYRVEHSVTAAATASAVAAQIGDLQRWTAWSPWDPPDSELQLRFAGAPGRPGHSYYWSSADGSRRGRTTILVAGPDRIELEREVERPIASSTDIEVSLRPDPDGGARITWVMTGENDLRAKVLDPRGRRHLEEVTVALSRLKAVIEAQERIEKFRIERSTTIAARPATILAQLRDPRSWVRWSPWESGRSDVNRAYGGPPAGKGSSYYWSEASGRGRLTILDATDDAVEVELAVGQPRSYACDLELRVAPERAGARVTWTVSGTGDEARAALYPGGDAERELGATIARGLASLKTALEATAAAGPTNAPRRAR